MSLKRNVPEMIAQKLPQKGKQAGIDTTGLRKRPQFEQIVNYLTYGQENVVYPDREAKLIREHPFMTQLDFFDMQEDQKMKWEEQTRQHEAEMIAEKTGVSAASVKASKATQTSGSTRDMGASPETNGTKNTGASTQTGGQTSAGRIPPKQRMAGSGGIPPKQEMSSSSNQQPIYAHENLYGAFNYSGSMEKGVRVRGKPGQQPNNPIFAENWRGAEPGAGPAPAPVPGNPIFADGWQGKRPSAAAAAVTNTLALQEQGATVTLQAMEVAARKRVTESTEQVAAQRRNMSEQVGAMLAQPVPQPTAPQPIDHMTLSLDLTEPQKRSAGAADEIGNAKRIITRHMGEKARDVPFLRTPLGVMDERAQEAQANAGQAAAAMVAAAAGNGTHDVSGLANALNEPVPTATVVDVPAEAAVPEVFNIATPRERERSPRGRGKGRGGKNTVSGALAAIAAEKQSVPENVDAGIAPTARKRTGRHGWDPTARTQNNFSPQLNADQILDIKLVQNSVKQQAGRLTIQDGEPDAKKSLRSRSRSRGQLAIGDGSAMTRSDRKKQKLEEVQQKQLFANETKRKAIVAEDASRPTEKAPKLANESSTEEVKGKPAEMPQFSGSLTKQQIADRYLEFFNDDKSVKSLIAMTKANLLIYVQSKVPVQAAKADKLVKPTTVKPGKAAQAQRNKGIKA